MDRPQWPPMEGGSQAERFPSSERWEERREYSLPMSPWPDSAAERLLSADGNDERFLANLPGTTVEPSYQYVPAGSELVTADGEQYLFFLLAGQEYALKAAYLQSVERLTSITPVPNTVAWVLGVVHLHGIIVSVVDLRTFWGLGAVPSTPRTRLMVAQVGEMAIALVVDGVVGMRVLPNRLIQAVGDPRSIPSWVTTVVTQIAVVNNQAVLLLDLERLFSSEQMQRYMMEE